MPEISVATEELHRLYQQGWSLQRLADKHGISKQAIHCRFRWAGLERRRRGTQRIWLNTYVNVEEFEKLYVQQGLPLREIAKMLNIALSVLRTEIKKHPRMRKMKRGCSTLPEINKLKVGESFLMPRADRKGANFTRYYVIARRLGIRVSIQSEGTKQMRITRVG